MIDFNPQEMDNAAAEAENDLTNISDEALLPVADWFLKYYMRAGYKRLGRILVNIAKEHQSK